MNRNRERIIIVVIMILALIGACTHTIHVPTSQEKLLTIYQIYNAQHEDYVAMSKMTNLTEGQKEMMRAKKPILETLQKLIPAYDQTVQAGTPSYETEQKIYGLLNQLQAMAL